MFLQLLSFSVKSVVYEDVNENVKDEEDHFEVQMQLTRWWGFFLLSSAILPIAKEELS